VKKAIKNYLEFLSQQPQGTVYQEENQPLKKTKQAQLDEIKAKYRACSLCPLGTLGRKNVVFGAGDPNAELMFIGEGPGRDEDTQALPFVGRAGKLLEKIIEAMGLTREKVFISNVVKCRPPQNRTPLPNESQICKNEILLKEINIVTPRAICTLGTVATQGLLGEAISISRARGNIFYFQNIPVLPTFHPAYLLRNPEQKKTVWNDMQQLMKLLANAH
jgi:uracil-DNA glycosylase